MSFLYGLHDRVDQDRRTVPFYLSKSLRAGPFRLNLSSRGVGVSAGVPGFRVGTGPRGNYVRLAGGLIFYGASRAARSRRAPAPQPQAIPYQLGTRSEPPLGNHEPWPTSLAPPLAPGLYIDLRRNSAISQSGRANRSASSAREICQSESRSSRSTSARRIA